MKKNLIPPPLVAVILATVIWWFKTDTTILEKPGQTLIAIAIVLIGTAICIDITAIYAFYKAKTTIDPLRPEKASMIVTSGPFRFTRNPMYLGLSLLLAGWGLIQNSWLLVPAVIGFVIYMTHMQIIPEEKILAEKFGEPYLRYQQTVRRWL